MNRLKIKLIKLPSEIKFIDLKSGKLVDKPNKLFIRDICYDKFIAIYEHFKREYSFDLVFTDIFRTQKEQVEIYRDRLLHPEKGIAAKPCLSPHLYGHAFDIYTHNFKGFTYRYFESFVMKYGFRGISSESWHFQYITQKVNNFMEEILFMCRPFLPMTMEEIYNHLELAGYKRNTQGIMDFQRDFGLTQDGIAGQQTQIRLLLYNTEYIFCN